MEAGGMTRGGYAWIIQGRLLLLLLLLLLRRWRQRYRRMHRILKNNSMRRWHAERCTANLPRELGRSAQSARPFHLNWVSHTRCGHDRAFGAYAHSKHILGCAIAEGRGEGERGKGVLFFPQN